MFKINCNNILTGLILKENSYQDKSYDMDYQNKIYKDEKKRVLIKKGRTGILTYDVVKSYKNFIENENTILIIYSSDDINTYFQIINCLGEINNDSIISYVIPKDFKYKSNPNSNISQKEEPRDFNTIKTLLKMYKDEDTQINVLTSEEEDFLNFSFSKKYLKDIHILTNNEVKKIMSDVEIFEPNSILFMKRITYFIVLSLICTLIFIGFDKYETLRLDEIKSKNTNLSSTINNLDIQINEIKKDKYFKNHDYYMSLEKKDIYIEE